MKKRLLRILLFAAAFTWGVSALGVVLPWQANVTLLTGLGAGPIPADPMLDYWLRMTAGAFTGIGIAFLSFALRPARFASVIGLAGALMFAEGAVILIHGLRLGLPPFPFYFDTAACLFIGAEIWWLRDAAGNET